MLVNNDVTVVRSGWWWLLAINDSNRPWLIVVNPGDFGSPPHLDEHPNSSTDPMFRYCTSRGSTNLRSVGHGKFPWPCGCYHRCWLRLLSLAEDADQSMNNPRARGYEPTGFVVNCPVDGTSDMGTELSFSSMDEKRRILRCCLKAAGSAYLNVCALP